VYKWYAPLFPSLSVSVYVYLSVYLKFSIIFCVSLSLVPFLLPYLHLFECVSVYHYFRVCLYLCLVYFCPALSYILCMCVNIHIHTNLHTCIHTWIHTFTYVPICIHTQGPHGNQQTGPSSEHSGSCPFTNLIASELTQCRSFVFVNFSPSNTCPR